MNMIGKELCPAVKRARDFKLYTYDGRVLLDLYRENGRAFSGHKSGKLVLTLKNAAEQGVFCSYPSVYGGRLQKALRTLFPAFPYSAVFSGESAARRRTPSLTKKRLFAIRFEANREVLSGGGRRFRFPRRRRRSSSFCLPADFLERLPFVRGRLFPQEKRSLRLKRPF